MKVTRIGLDLAKNVFEIHGVDAEEQVAVRRTLRRGKVLEYFAQLPPCLIGMEACGGAHYWARELMKLGHDTRLMAPQFVAPYRKSNKSDRNDAQAICEALGRPSMPFVAVKDEEQQAVMMLHRMRSLLVGERTALVNQTRGLLGDFGIVVGQHIGRLRARLPQILEDGQRGLPTLARELFADLYRRLRELDAKIGAYDRGRADCVWTKRECRQRACGQGRDNSRQLWTAIGQHRDSELPLPCPHSFTLCPHCAARAMLVNIGRLRCNNKQDL